MMFWILAALLSAAVIALFAWPLLSRRGKDADADSVADLSVYRDQLSELDRDVARGLLPTSEAASARLEIQRRLLAAANTTAPAPSASGGRIAPAAALLLFLPAIAVAVYLHVGSPSLPSQPLASRAIAPNGDQQLINLAGLLETKLDADPSDPKAWALLGKIKGELGRYQESADAYTRAIARHQAVGDAPEADLQSLYGEALTATSAGQVTPKAKAAFAAALALDPKEPRARFYLALSDAQAGNFDMALKQWIALEADTPADAPWRPTLEDQINAAARQLGRDPATLPGRAAQPPVAAPSPANGPASGPASGPTGEDMAKAAAMTDQQRAAFIDSMVSGLADRLKAQPSDVDGWLKLAKAYDQLGRTADAKAAWREAANRAPERLDAQIAYASALAPLAEQAPLPEDFTTVVARIRKLAPDNGLGLYCAGLIARSQGDKAGAKALWLQVIPLIPEGSPQRKELEAKIAALGV